MFTKILNYFRGTVSTVGDVVAILIMLVLLMGAGWAVATAFTFLRPFFNL